MGRYTPISDQAVRVAAKLGIAPATFKRYKSLGFSDFTDAGLAAFRASTPGTKAEYRKKRRSTTPHHYFSPKTHAVWYLSEIRQDLRSFPDWSSIWATEAKRRSDSARGKERWANASDEKKRAVSEKARLYRRTKEGLAKQREYRAKRRAEDRSINIKDSLRARLRKFIHGNHKSGIRDLLGCSWAQFRRHLESQFKRGMTWANYGAHWHIDHIVPVSRFDHSDPKQVAQCWHWTNLRPLEAAMNLAKSDRLTEPQLSLLLPV